MSTEKQRAEQMRRARAELRRQPRVVTEEKVLRWRKQQFVRMGFSMGEAQTLAVRGDVDLHETADWLAAGATHTQVLLIVAPIVGTATDLVVIDDDEPRLPYT